MSSKISKAPASSSVKASTKKTERKSVQKQPLPVPERLKRLFTSLCAQIDGGHFQNAIKTCDKILRLEPQDADALQTKLFLLLQTEQYQAALTLVTQGTGKSHHDFARAYSLYRLQQETEARDILKSMKNSNDEYDDRGAVHLDAQLNYRQGLYEEAFDLYNQLLDTAEPQSEEHSDILINLQASQQHLDFINTNFLRSLDGLSSSVRNNIETVPPPAQSMASIVNAIPSGLAAAGVSVQQSTAPEIIVKKVRKSRIPAGVIPGVTPPPDPERWLKKSERSNYGQGKRRRGFGGGGATQGSANVDAVHPAVTNTPHPAKSSGLKGKKKK